MDEEEKKEYMEFQECVRKWAIKKMRKQEKRLEFFARIYFGEPVSIIYSRKEKRNAFRSVSE